jgi:hypothetical protein
MDCIGIDDISFKSSFFSRKLALACYQESCECQRNIKRMHVCFTLTLGGATLLLSHHFAKQSHISRPDSEDGETDTILMGRLD